MSFLEAIMLATAILFLIGAIDDLLFDLAYAINGIKPRSFSKARWNSWMKIPEKPMAILIPAWQEHGVLESMVLTNLKRIEYQNYRWFLGVYPNDEQTLDIARRLEKQYPEKVVVVVTDKPGPTSKAHCLNCVLDVIDGMNQIARTQENGWIPYYIGVHDAEDVIHPKSFKLINAQPSKVAFIQVPIFSLPVPLNSWVSGTYLDEFAEIHLKDMPVRQLLGLPIPSAGVGTFLKWSTMEEMYDKYGYWLNQNNLVEDYDLALRVSQANKVQKFLLVEDEKGEIIATREYFPEHFWRSMNQKTRWTTGICFQTTSQWKWFGAWKKPWIPKNLATMYSLFRDRKAIWANPTIVFAWGLMVVSVIWIMIPGSTFYKHISNPALLRKLFALNLTLFTIRMYQRVNFCSYMYGKGHGALSIPRVLLSTVINGFSCFKSYRNFFLAAAKNQHNTMVWDKTEHKFPTLDTIENTSGKNG